MRIGDDVGVIVLQDRAQEAVLGVADRLDDVAVVARKVEEGARLARRTELREDVLGRQREQVVGRIEPKVVLQVTEARLRQVQRTTLRSALSTHLSQVAKDPRRIIFELEVVSRRGRELVADTAKSNGDGRQHLKPFMTTGRNSHVERVLVLCLEVFRRQRARNLGLRPRDLTGRAKGDDDQRRLALLWEARLTAIRMPVSMSYMRT